VERGEEIVITGDGKPVARLVPDQPSSNRDQVQAASTVSANALAGTRAKIPACLRSTAKMKKLRDEGRR
jgi:antitoxin (DNA-binding transcriptional repressor) of toxin-antitoxin stability system